MPVFKYTAQTPEGKTIASTIDAASLSVAIDALTTSRLRVVEIKKINFDPTEVLRQMAKVDQQNVVLFTRRLSTLIISGLPLARSMQVLYEQETDAKLKMALMSVLHDIRTGSSLSWAMAKYPDVFSNLFISMVKVGEATGELGAMLDKLADFLERDFKVKKQATSALTYPAFIMIFCVLMVSFIFLYILPSIMKVFAGMNRALPLPTQIVFFIIETLRNPYVQLAAVVGVVYYVIYFRDSLRTPEGRFRFDKFKVKIPLLGDLNRKMLIANFCRAMGILLSAGIPMMKSMEILLEFMDNAYFKQIVVQPIYEEVKTGTSVGQAVEEVGFFPNMVSNMIAVGEATGEMPIMLSKISTFYDTEVLYALEGFLAMLEPILIGGMGIIVCFVLLAVFMPLYQLVMNM